MERRIVIVKAIKSRLCIAGLVLAILTAATGVSGCNCDDETNSINSTTWKLYGYGNTNDNTFRSLDQRTLPADRYTISFSGDGTISGKSHIHKMDGRYQISGNSIWITVAVLDNGEKGGAANDYAVEKYFLNSLAKSTVYEIKNEQLRLYHNDMKDYLLFVLPGTTLDGVEASDYKVEENSTETIRAEDRFQTVHVNDVVTIRSVRPSAFLHMFATYSDFEGVSTLNLSGSFNTWHQHRWIDFAQTDETTFKFKIAEPSKWDSVRYINADIVGVNEFARSSITFHLVQ